jgi:phospholipase/lecithinase/hemolysin
MKIKLATSLLLLAFFNPASNAYALSISSLVAFGDSLSDAGNSDSAVLSIYKLNNNACDPTHPCGPYVDGHYTNGSTAVEYLANAILPSGTVTSNFKDYAVSGATTGLGNFGDGGSATNPGAYPLPGMAYEVGYYLTSTTTIDPNTLFFIWGGANDFLTQSSPVEAAKNIALIVKTLATVAGAKNFFIPNLPDLGLTPFAIFSSLQTQANAFTVAFNATLSSELTQLATQIPLANLIQFDTFSFFNDLYANSGQYGFTNKFTPCVTGLTACAHPDENIFWDGFHPTTAVHELISVAFQQAIPEPSSIVLILMGLLLLTQKYWQPSKRLAV